MLGRDLSMVSDGVFEVIVGFDISEDKILTYMVGIKRDMLARNAITEAAILGFVRDAVEEIMRVAEA